MFFGGVEGAFFAEFGDGEFGGVAAGVASAPGGLPVFVFSAGGVLGDDVGDSLDAAFFDVAAAAGEGVESVFGEFFDEGVAVASGGGEGGGFAVMGFIGEEFGIDLALEGDAHEPAVVAFFWLVDAADAVIGAGELHVIGSWWGEGGGIEMMAMGSGAGKGEALGSGLIAADC